MRLNHIAIAVPCLKEASHFYVSVLGAEVSSPLSLPDHGVRVVFVKLENITIELLEGEGENSPIKKFLEKNPLGGIHHISLEVTDLSKALEKVRLENIRILGEVKKGAHDVPVAFLHPKDCLGTLIELEETGK